MNVARFERFFRLAASLDVDKADLKRFDDFVRHKTYDLLIRGQAVAEANGRDVLQPWDLPITKGLQERIHEFREIDEQIDLQSILAGLTGLPLLDRGYSEELVTELPNITGGLSLALARVFKVIDQDLKNPMPEHWERVFRIFDLLV